MSGTMPVSLDLAEFLETGKGTLHGSKINNPKTIIVTKDTDFAALEALVLAAMTDPAVASILVDIETSAGGDIPSPFDFALAMVPKDRPLKARKAPPSYHRHDRTKSHRRPGR